MNIDDDIAALDLDPIAFKLALDERWGLRRIDAKVLEYRIFLQAVRDVGGGVVPTRPVDKVWHHHILDTEKYREDCERLFGRFIDHYPYSGLFGPEDSARQRRRFEQSLLIYDEIRRSTASAINERRGK